MLEEEKSYLMGLVTSVSYDPNKFTVPYGDADKVIAGAFLKDKKADDFFKYKTVFDTLFDLDWKIKKALTLAIDFAYRPELSEFSVVALPGQIEKETSYHIENAVFRTVICWDMLAQMYNVEHKVVEDITQIHYKKFFMKQLDDPEAQVIAEYLNEESNLEVEPWEGNHEFVGAYRNQMAHRNSPNIATFSHFSLKVRDHPRFILKRVVEDYAAVSSFIACYMRDLKFDDQ